MFQICFGLYLGGEILAHRPHVGGGIFYTEFIQICEKYRFHGESSQNVRDHVFCSSRFELPKVARPIRVPVRVTPCFRMPPRGPRAPPAI